MRIHRVVGEDCLISGKPASCYSVTQQLCAAIFFPVLAFGVDERMRWHNQGKNGGERKKFLEAKVVCKICQLEFEEVVWVIRTKTTYKNSLIDELRSFSSK